MYENYAIGSMQEKTEPDYLVLIKIKHQRDTGYVGYVIEGCV